jgi:predicted small secreted protein
MMQKKYLMVSLLAAAALLSGCSDNTSGTGAGSGNVFGQPTESSTPAPTRTDGLINPSVPESKVIPSGTFEDAAVDIVKIPQSVVESEGYVPIPFAETSGAVVETEDDVTMVFNDTFEREAAHQWVADLEAQGWKISGVDTVDNETTYNVVLLKPDRVIAMYANNTPETINTVISFTK